MSLLFVLFSSFAVGYGIGILNQTAGMPMNSFFDDYQRGYPVKYNILEMDMVELERLLVDVRNIKMPELDTMISHALHRRFNPYWCASPNLLNLAQNGKSLQRIGTPNKHMSCAVNGVMYSGTRYMEFEIVSSANEYVMIGVAQYNQGNLQSGPYPGSTKVPGISYYGANGKLFRHGSHQSWGSTTDEGDRIGVLVEICEEKTTAFIQWYYNGVKIQNSLNLKDYMSVDGGILFVVNLYTVGDEVRIIQDPVVPVL